jgi:hypothetical protein
MKIPEWVRRWWYKWWHGIDTRKYGVKLPTFGKNEYISMERKGSYIDITIPEEHHGIQEGRIRLTPYIDLSGFEVEYHYEEGDVTRHTRTTPLRYSDIYMLVSGTGGIVQCLSGGERARFEQAEAELAEIKDALDAMHERKYDWPGKSYRSPCVDGCEACDFEATLKGLRAAKTLMK